MKTIKNRIIEKLTATNRQGMGKLIDWLNGEGFFTSPASTRFHGSYPGGLAQHSWDVFQNMEGIMMGLDGIDQPVSPGQRPLPVTKNNLVIAALLHDLNKVGLYVKTKPGSKYKYRCDKGHPKGHGELSINFASQYITLEPIEILMMRFHMGIYGTFELGDYCAEYPLKNDHSKDKKDMTAAEKEADKDARYCTSLRNVYYHNPICKLLSIADELATQEEKLKDYQERD